MAEAAAAGGESPGAEPKAQQPTEKARRAPPRRDPRSVLKVSQVLLRAIDAHRGLTLTALKRELGNAGYQVRSKGGRPSAEAPKSDVKGTLVRVSGSDAAGYFRVWKIPKPKRKPRRPRLEAGVRPTRRASVGPRGPWKPRVRRRAAEKTGQVRRRSARANATRRRLKPRAKDPVRSKAKEETRAEAANEGRGRTAKEDRPRTRGEKPREEKQRDPETPVKRTTQRATSVKADATAPRPKRCTKPESPRNAAAGSP